MKVQVWASGQLVSGLLVGRVLLGNVCSDFTLPLLPQAAAPRALWGVPRVPRAMSAKGPRTSAAAAPDVGATLPQVSIEQPGPTCSFFLFIQPDSTQRSCFYETLE